MVRLKSRQGRRHLLALFTEKNVIHGIEADLLGPPRKAPGEGLNAEIDATIGPILQVYAAKHGVILSACDGDEPGVQINLCRWVRGLGLTPRVIGNVKGLQDPYRTPTTQKGFAERWQQNRRCHAQDRCQEDRAEDALNDVFKHARLFPLR